MVVCKIIMPGLFKADHSIGARLSIPEGILKVDENGYPYSSKRLKLSRTLVCNKPARAHKEGFYGDLN